MDACGPTVPIGGGARSGKDWHKVDCKGGRLAREMALELVRTSGAAEALVWFESTSGCNGPVQVERATTRCGG
jgi:S-adenosylmethionine synthetase